MAEIDNILGNTGNEITLIYHSGNIDDRKAYIFLDSMNGFVLKTIDLAHDKLTATQLAGLADTMHITPRQLFCEGAETAAIHENKEDYSDADYLDWLQDNQELIETPITIWNGETRIWKSAYDLIRHGMDMKRTRSVHANQEEKGLDEEAE